MSRPLIQKSIQELEQMVERNAENTAELELIRIELLHRSTNAATELRDRVKGLIEGPETAEQSDEASTISDEVREWTNEAVARLRAKLIDLSRRSPLIAFKHTSRSASILRIVDERTDLLFEQLSKGPMGFEPLPGEDETPPDEKTPEFQIALEKGRLTDEIFQDETQELGDEEADIKAWQEAERGLRTRTRQLLGLPALEYGKGIDLKAIALAHGFDPSYDLGSSDDELSDHHEDENIRVLLTQKLLDKRLKTIWDRSRSHMRETGHHTLFLAFGFVQWFEDDASDLPQQAPLLLLPVALDRTIKRGRYEFSLRALDDGLDVNVALKEKAREHWGIELPELREEETPESYFIRAEQILGRGRRLSLRTFATLAVLPPMVLWRDLDPASWPADAFASHRLLPGLIGAEAMSGGDAIGEQIDIDDPSNDPIVPSLITDADASQHSAIIDMVSGHDLAIEGPPGTGKSQTITNMVAAAVAKGKRVLFVAEKQAALRVVSDRLRVAGFGPLVLELHGERANRNDVYDGIRERLDAKVSHDIVKLESKREDLKRHRNLLRRYLLLIRKQIGSLGRTAYDLAWRDIRLRSGISAESIHTMQKAWTASDLAELKHSELQENRERLDQFGRAQEVLEPGEDEGHRTHWIHASILDPFDQSTTLSLSSNAADAAGRLTESIEAIAELGFQLPMPKDDILPAALQLSSLERFSCEDEKVLLAAVNDPETSKNLLQAQHKWTQLFDRLSEDLSDPSLVRQAQVDELRDSLSIDYDGADFEQLLTDIADLEDFEDALRGAAGDLDALISMTNAGRSQTVDNLHQISKTFAEYCEFEENVGLLISPDLFEPTSGLQIKKSKAEAESLRGERAALAIIFEDDAFLCEPGELEEIALTLRETGLIGRLLGSSYRSANRRSRRWLQGELDRLDLADELIRLSRLVRDERAFSANDASKCIFPNLLWEGVDSDFESLGAAHQFLNDASSTFETLSEGDLLSDWLKLSLPERIKSSRKAQRIAHLCETSTSFGFQEIAIEDLDAQVTCRIKALFGIQEALEAIEAKPKCRLTIADLSIHEVLYDLLAAASTFAELRAHPRFEWVGPPSGSLGSLDATLAEIESAAQVPGPVPILEGLRSTDQPGHCVRQVLQHVGELSAAANEWLEAKDELEKVGGIESLSSLSPQSWSQLTRELTAMSGDQSGATQVADLLKYRQALKRHGLEAFAQASIKGEVRPSQLADMYELLVTASLLQLYLGGDGEELGRLGSLSLQDARKLFKRTDKELHRLEANAIVSARLRDEVPIGVGYGRKSDYTDFELLNHEVNLKRPRTPMRDVVHRAGAALQALKPIWMMSPSSVAQYIGRGNLHFDLLIVDEASQMRPEFSISSILRADQFVVVGDANQLPPSDHFQIANINEDDDAVGVDENTESILDLANQKFRQKRRLRWHYRSQHESLIQFSNQQFYDHDLVIFPSPSGNDDDLLGVKCIYVPSVHNDTIYDASINQREAETTIEQAFALMQSHPERSIGIVAMNAKQTELIKAEFDRLVLEEEVVRKYVESFAETIDEFFIKNLENVQGDERDIILISTVYGPNKDGVVRQNFGLMNREVGWRRLNVLVTRAKMSCRLITSLRPDDVKISDNSSKGVIAFKGYLTYAHGGPSTAGRGPDEGEPDSDFEVFVADALRAAGYEVIYQVGVAGFRIDLGVRHADYPVGFIAGIECDGAPYHTGLSVRDRDYIRQTVLEGLGWNIFRVWSTDWFQDPARQTAKMVAWVDQQKQRLVKEMPRGDPITAPTGQIGELDRADAETPDEEPEAKSDLVARTDARDEIETSLFDEEEEPREPRGREMRDLGDFEWYEAIRGQLYEIWRDDEFLGEVEVIKRATSAPRLYGDHVLAARSEYEGRVEATGDSFSSYDVYAAVKEVATRSKEAEKTSSSAIQSNAATPE